MVEKIIINPEEIRGYGNIIIPHVTSDYDVVNASLESGTDTVNGQSMTVYELEYAPNLTNTVLSLSVSQSSVYVYDNVVFTAVLEDEDDNPISGATVTFKEGDTVLGTDTTDNTGEASLTLSNLTAGSHSVTANYSGDSTYASSTSSSVSVTVSHSYSLSFSSSSYVATGGSATLECTLLDNNVPVEGATISVSGSDSSLYSGITNSSGTASITVSNISSETTFTASYGGATATCTVNVVSYLFRDGGVTGDYNTNYTNLNSAVINVSVDNTGTTMVCSSGYGDKFRKANTLISGDFEIKYTCISATVVYGSMRFLTTSNGNMFTVEQYVDNKVGINNTNYPIGETITFPFIMTIQRVGNKLSVWYNDIQVASNLTVSTNDGYFSWKFYANESRSQTFKDLTITQL